MVLVFLRPIRTLQQGKVEFLLFPLWSHSCVRFPVISELQNSFCVTAHCEDQVSAIKGQRIFFFFSLVWACVNQMLLITHGVMTEKKHFILPMFLLNYEITDHCRYIDLKVNEMREKLDKMQKKKVKYYKLSSQSILFKMKSIV